MVHFQNIGFFQSFLLIVVPVEKLLWNIMSCKIALNAHSPLSNFCFVLLLYEEEAVKTEKYFGYGIWMGSF